MKTLKKTLIKAVCALLIFSFIPVTGCSIIGDFKENLESRMERKREERKEDDKARSFSTAHDFEDYYEKEIKHALQNNDKKALKGLFCEAVLDNTYDMNEGLEYLFGLKDWSEFSFSGGNCSSRKEYHKDGRWEFVNCRLDLAKGNEKYRLFYSGYATCRDKVDGKTRQISANLGLANLCIGKLNSKGALENPVYNYISGIGHPGREKTEKIIGTVFNIYEPVKKDGAFDETVTDEALAVVMTDGLKNGADKSELDAFIRFIRIGSLSKKTGYFFYLRKEGGGVTVTGTFRFTLKDLCITILIKDGKIDGAAVQEGNEEPNAQSGKIKGFSNIVK
ncbi:MAG: DUF5104 domain-containing protein [Saccharofermentans sp.]|nr:DUF5104 domain-containing protein [Saccharofermentans sp.]